MAIFIEDSSDDTLHVNEESTAVFTVAFTDEDGNDVTPDSIAWSLTDDDGDVINSRDEVAIAAPAASVTITLSGDDLALQDGETGRTVKRHLIVEAVYDSDTVTNSPLKEDGVFYIDNLTKV